MKGPDDLSTDAVMAWLLGMRKATPVELALEESARRSAEEKRQQSSSAGGGNEDVHVPAPADARGGEAPPPAYAATSSRSRPPGRSMTPERAGGKARRS